MTMWNAEGREADAERDAEEAREAEQRKKPIELWTMEEFPNEPHWVIMTFEKKNEPVKRGGSKLKHIVYTAYLDKSVFEAQVRHLGLRGAKFKAFHVDAIAEISVEVSI